MFSSAQLPPAWSPTPASPASVESQQQSVTGGSFVPSRLPLAPVSPMAAGPASYQLMAHQPRQHAQPLAKALVRLYKTPFQRRLLVSRANAAHSPPTGFTHRPHKKLWLKKSTASAAFQRRPSADCPPLLSPQPPSSTLPTSALGECCRGWVL